MLVIKMEGIGLDSLPYLSEDSFAGECNNDFSDICEDIEGQLVACETAFRHLDPLQFVSGNNSPPSSSYYSSVRGFEKEMPSLFSDMEYLTEVSSDMDLLIYPTCATPKTFDVSEFTWVDKQGGSDIVAEPVLRLNEETSLLEDSDKNGRGSLKMRYNSCANYKKILQNYIEKGKQRLEECSYSKGTKASVVSVKAGTNSTSLIETVTCSSYANGQSNNTQDMVFTSANLSNNAQSSLPSLPNSYRCPDCGSCFLNHERLRKHVCIITEQYQCEICRREFRKRKTLEQHLKTHEKVFSTDDDLRRW